MRDAFITVFWNPFGIIITTSHFSNLQPFLIEDEVSARRVSTNYSAVTCFWGEIRCDHKEDGHDDDHRLHPPTRLAFHPRLYCGIFLCRDLHCESFSFICKSCQIVLILFPHLILPLDSCNDSPNNQDEEPLDFPFTSSWVTWKSCLRNWIARRLLSDWGTRVCDLLNHQNDRYPPSFRINPLFILAFYCNSSSTGRCSQSSHILQEKRYDTDNRGMHSTWSTVLRLTNVMSVITSFSLMLLTLTSQRHLCKHLLLVIEIYDQLVFRSRNGKLQEVLRRLMVKISETFLKYSWSTLSLILLLCYWPLNYSKRAYRTILSRHLSM